MHFRECRPRACKSVTLSCRLRVVWGCGVWLPFLAAGGNSDRRGRHPEFEPPVPPLSASFLTGSNKHRRCVSKMAEIIETEFGIRALQAALVERRNTDSGGHVFCNLRLIIVPGGSRKGRGGMGASPRPANRLPWVCWGEGWAKEAGDWREQGLSVGQGKRRGHGLQWA